MTMNNLAKYLIIIVGLTITTNIESMEKDSLQYTYSSEEFEEVTEFIQKNFGYYEMVMGEKVSDGPCIDIVIIEPNKKRDYYILCTIGAGAYTANVDKEKAPFASEHLELLIYLPKDWKISPEAFNDENNYWPIRHLKATARIPYYENSYLDFGHTVSNEGEEPFAANTDKVGMILLSPIPDPLDPITCELSSGKEVEFLQLLPITKEEMQFKLNNGANALIARLEDSKKKFGTRKWIDFILSRFN